MATGSVAPFAPLSTVTVSAGTTAASGTVPAADSVLVYNASGATAFVSFSGTASATNGAPVPAGGRQIFRGAPSPLTASVILAGGSGDVFLTAGNGTAI